MKSRCLLNFCNSTSQFISIMFRCSLLFFFFLFYQIKNFLFLLQVNLYMITGIYLHDPPPFNGPFFMTPPFSESQNVVTLPLFPPPSPPANFWQVPKHYAGAPNDNFRKNIFSEDDFRSRIFGTFVVRFLAYLLLLGFSNI